MVLALALAVVVVVVVVLVAAAEVTVVDPVLRPSRVMRPRSCAFE